ncbi:MAG: helix-turn-helix transcriptional regulator, partial [Chitinophagaceae bacterium]|nr:helix-turn-helix transcriptional regulator [Chitinophagaceae bacterium]
TRREKEVLSLIAEGMTNNEIAAQLFISSATVDTHRKNLLAKFATKNTASLIRKAAQMQLL